MRESARGSPAARAALVAVAVMLGCAGTALAVVPHAGVYRGTTEQRFDGDHHVRVKVSESRRVAVVDVAWRAKCKAKGRFWYGATRFENPAEDGGHFHDAGTYDGGTADEKYDARITVAMDGHFTSASRVRGTFSSKVKVVKASTGHHVDSCKMSTHWHATSD
jgi:hypothetical protein